MTPKYLKIIEFDKILAKAAEAVTCPEAREQLVQQPPFENTEEVRDALQRTDAMTILLLKNGSPRFNRVENVLGIVRRAEKGGVLSMAELLAAANTLRNFRNLAQWYTITEHDYLHIDDLFFTLSPQPQLEKVLFDAILSEKEMADTASDTLYDLRRKIRNAENSIRDKLDGIIKSSNTNKYLQESVVSLRNGRFVVPVKAEYKSELGGVIHDVSSSGSTLFVEPTAIVEANAKIMQLRSQEQAEIERILAAFSAQVAGEGELFTVSYQSMLQIDVLLAKAKLALDQHASMPEVVNGYSFHLVKARHPLIDKTKVVPVDIALGQAYDTMIITGPNTGGKTVTLKTAGLLCCMAQYGYMIPAHETSTVCVFSDILADIGDEQSIEQSLSTFSGHIKNITEILRQVNNTTLVLLDELGAGTDPAEGAALAVAIIEQLRQNGAKVMATTHYAELKVFALDTQGVQNASCEFDVESLRPTYKLSVGVPGKSNAFLISEKLGIPQSIIVRAGTHLSSEDKKFDNILAQLDTLKLELKNKQAEIEDLRDGAKAELEQARKEKEKLIAQGQTELANAREKAQDMAKNVENTAYTLLDELRKIEKDNKQSAGQRAIRAREIAKKEAEKLFTKADVVHQVKREFVPLQNVKIGQEVEIAELAKRGIVVNLPDRNGLVEVRAGVLKTKVPLSGLCQPDKRQQKAKAAPQPRSTSSTLQSTATRTPSMEINLLGMNIEEALHEVDKFIDNGVMSNQNMLYLIHGNGTGALRSAIHAHLRGHKSVKSFRLGRYGEGETGVTVVELK